MNKKILSFMIVLMLSFSVVFIFYKEPLKAEEVLENPIVWMTSDWHVGYPSNGYNAHGDTAVADINANVDIDIAFNVGDIVDRGGESGQWTQFHTWWNSVTGTGDCIYKNYTIGNHEVAAAYSYSGDYYINDWWKDYTSFQQENYTVSVGNLLFIIIGSEGNGSYNQGKIGTDRKDNRYDDQFAWFNTTVQNNQNMNIIVLSHHPIYNTVYDSTGTSQYVKSGVASNSDEYIWVLEHYNVAMWVCGHTHEAHSQSNMVVIKHGTTHLNLGDNRDHYEDRVFYFVSDSTSVTVKSRNHNTEAWQASYECTVELDYPYEPSATKKESITGRFVVVADARSYITNGIDPTFDYINTLSPQPDFVIYAGDMDPISSADANITDHGWNVNETEWDVIYVTGNHDSPPQGETHFINNIAPYYPNSTSPAYADINFQGTVFSFDYGDDVHIVITNQYWNNSNGGYCQDQLDWLEDELINNSDKQLFVVGHEPAFPFNRHVGDSLDLDVSNRNTFWQMLEDYNVSAYICGHTHYASMYQNMTNGTTQIDAGAFRGIDGGENPVKDVVIFDVDHINHTTTVDYFEAYDSGSFQRFDASFQSTYHSDDNCGNIDPPFVLRNLSSTEDGENITFHSINEQQNNTNLQDNNRTFIWNIISDATNYSIRISNYSDFHAEIFLQLDNISLAEWGTEYYSEANGNVFFILPDQYNITEYKYHYYQVRAYT